MKFEDWFDEITTERHHANAWPDEHNKTTNFGLRTTGSGIYLY